MTKLMIAALVMTAAVTMVTPKAMATAQAGTVANEAAGDAANAKPQYEQLGFQSETEMQNYLTVSNVKVTEIPMDVKYSATVAGPVGSAELAGGLLETLGPVLADPSGISGWIAFGKKVWDVVVANRPVANVQTTRVSVLPAEKTLWTQMSGWRGPQGASYEISAVNGFGTTVVNQKYTVSYNYGGQLNGKGRYLANVTIIPTTIDVGWGYTVNSNVEVGQILNSGTTDSPVPSVDLQLKWDMKTLLRESQGVDSFTVKGNGSLQHVSK